MSVRIGRIAGAPIRAHWSVLVVILMMAGSLSLVAFPTVYPEAGLTRRTLWATCAAMLFLLSILGHEIGHTLAAKRNQVGTEEITLWLLGGVARLSTQVQTASAEFQIAIAGPLTSALIGGLLVGVATLVRDGGSYGFAGTVFALVGMMNLVLAIANLLPGAPLDGGRVLTALLWRRSGEPELARITSGRYGLVVGALITIAGVIEIVTFGRTTGWLTIGTGVFIVGAARSEITSAFIRQTLRVTPVDHVMTSYPNPVPDSLTAHDWLASIPHDRVGTVVPVTRWSRDPIGYCVPRSAIRLSDAERSFTTLGQLMVPAAHVERAWVGEPVTAVLQRSGGAFERFGDDGIVVVHDTKSLQPIGTLGDLQLHRLFKAPNFWGLPSPITWRARVRTWLQNCRRSS